MKMIICGLIRWFVVITTACSRFSRCPSIVHIVAPLFVSVAVYDQAGTVSTNAVDGKVTMVISTALFTSPPLTYAMMSPVHSY